jgi:hypothetical protein
MHMFIYAIGAGDTVCKACIQESYEVCNICGLFRSKGATISCDPYLSMVHYRKAHQWVEWTAEFEASKPYDGY